jgi:hypothetical protein
VLSTAYNSQRKIAENREGNIFVCYIAKLNNTKIAFVVRSDDGGFTWKEVGHVPSNLSSERASLAIDSRGILHIVWTEGSGDKSQIYYANLTGNRWSKAVRLSSKPKPSQGFFECISIKSRTREEIKRFDFFSLENI